MEAEASHDVMALQTSGDGAPGVVQQGTAPERCRENGGIEGTSPGGSRWTARQLTTMKGESCSTTTRA